MLCLTTQVHAKKQVITIINSSDAIQEQDITQRIQTNIQGLLQGKHDIVIKTVNGHNNVTRIRKKIITAQTNKNTDIVISTGMVASQQLAHLKRYSKYKSFPKPSIASIVVDERLQGMSVPLAGYSGIKNFTYIKPKFDISADLQQFKQLYNYKTLGVVVDDALRSEKELIKALFKSFTSQPVTIIYVNSNNYKKVISEYKNKVSALYVSPLFTFSDQQLYMFFKTLNKNRLPSFAMLGRNYTEMGALASLSYSNYAEIHARRIALGVMKILDGKPAAGLPINLPTMDTDFVINMATADALNIHPSFDLLKQADTVNQFKNKQDSTELTIQDALKIALKGNLDIQKKRKSIKLASIEITEAKRAFLPNISVRYQATKVDKDFRLTQGAGATEKLYINAEQVLYSDQALSLYKARKIGVDATLAALKRVESQIIFNILSGFVTHFNAKRQAYIQQENTQRTRKLLAVAKRKNKIGYAGKLDVYRLESELAINQANLKKAEASYNQSQLVLKKQLNLPLDTKVNFVEIADSLSLLSLSNKQLAGDLNNHQQVALFTDYLLNVAMHKRPVIAEFSHKIHAQQKITDAEKRKWFMPTISLVANANKTVARHDMVENHIERTMSPKWDLNLVAQVPLFDRQQQTNNSKNVLLLSKLKLEKEELVKNIHLSLRSDMQTAMASYQQMELFKKSADSAKKNLGLITNLYKYGSGNITQLIEAQNNVLKSRLNAINAEQQFFLDYLKIEQQSGFYYFLATPTEQQEFISQFTKFSQKKPSKNDALSENHDTTRELAEIKFVDPDTISIKSFTQKPTMETVEKSDAVIVEKTKSINKKPIVTISNQQDTQ